MLTILSLAALIIGIVATFAYFKTKENSKLKLQVKQTAQALQQREQNRQTYNKELKDNSLLEQTNKEQLQKAKGFDKFDEISKNNKRHYNQHDSTNN